MTMRLVTRAEIDSALAGLDVLPLIEAGFVAYSEGRAVVPPVGELVLDRGETHIKYGFIRDEPYYVIKVASGFHDNRELGLPSGSGIMLLLCQKTGRPVAVLADEGHLTDVRTAAAGAVAARHLAPSRLDRIGVVGTGTQARLQLVHLRPVTGCRSVLVWGRSRERREAYCRDMSAAGFQIEATSDAAEVATTCNLIVTTTPAIDPILRASDIHPGTHITAIGSDTPDKQELEADILTRADVVVADSLSQCRTRGEIARALERGAISDAHVVELGDVIRGHVPGRTSDDQISVFDSTGVAVQDIQIATAVADALGVSPAD